MNKRNLSLHIFLFLIILPLISCAIKKEAVDIEDKNAQVILEKIALYEGAIKSLKGLAKVKIKTADNKVSYTQVTVASRPDMLRLEALNPFGKTVGFISSDGQKIYIISPSQRAVYDAATKFDLASIYPGLNLSITSTNLVNLILGRLPEGIYDMGASPEISAESGLIKLIFPSMDPASADYLWVNRQNSRVEKAEFSLSQSQRAQITYEYFDDLIEGFYFPRTIEFESKGLSISIVYEADVELNRSINKSLFRPAQESAKFVK